MRLFRKGSGRFDFVVSMAGVKLGDRILQLGIGDGRVLGAFAARVGISGQAQAVDEDPGAVPRGQAGAAGAGALVEIHTAPYGRLPFDDQAFDVVVIHDLLAPMAPEVRVGCLQEVRRVLRQGGRCFVLETSRRGGLAGLFQKIDENPHYEQGGGALGALQAEGFRPVRELADRDGLRFTEGVAPRDQAAAEP